MTLDAIIETLEKATGPDRQINEAIFELMHGRKRRVSTFEQYDPSEKLPAYTGSVDAALTLVPEGLPWMVRRSQPWDAAHPYSAAYVQTAEHDEHSAIARCPAIALCIAALKARMAE